MASSLLSHLSHHLSVSSQPQGLKLRLGKLETHTLRYLFGALRQFLFLFKTSDSMTIDNGLISTSKFDLVFESAAADGLLSFVFCFKILIS